MSKQSQFVICFCVSSVCLSSVLLQVFLCRSFLPGVSIKRRGEEGGRLRVKQLFNRGENFLNFSTGGEFSNISEGRRIFKLFNRGENFQTS